MPHKAPRYKPVTVLTATVTEIVGPDPNRIEVDIANRDSANAINLVGDAQQVAGDGFPIDAGQKVILTEEDGDDIKGTILAIAETADVNVRVREVFAPD